MRWQRTRATRTFDQLAATGRALAVRLEQMPDARSFDDVAAVLEKEGVVVPRRDAWGHPVIFAPYLYEGRLGGYALVEELVPEQMAAEIAAQSAPGYQFLDRDMIDDNEYVRYMPIAVEEPRGRSAVATCVYYHARCHVVTSGHGWVNQAWQVGIAAPTSW